MARGPALFLAVRPCQAALAALADIERPAVDGVRWVDLADLHVTLWWLGPVPVSNVVSAFEGWDPALPEVFVGGAPHRLGPSAWVLDADGVDVLAADAVSRHVEGATAARVPFVGHMTIARCAETVQLAQRWIEPVQIEPTSVELIASAVKPGVTGYQVVASWPSARGRERTRADGPG